MIPHVTKCIERKSKIKRKEKHSFASYAWSVYVVWQRTNSINYINKSIFFFCLKKSNGAVQITTTWLSVSSSFFESFLFLSYVTPRVRFCAHRNRKIFFLYFSFTFQMWSFVFFVGSRLRNVLIVQAVSHASEISHVFFFRLSFLLRSRFVLVTRPDADVDNNDMTLYRFSQLSFEVYAREIVPNMILFVNKLKAWRKLSSTKMV